MTDWELALWTASDALELAQDLQGTDSEISKAELKAKLAKLAAMLADLKQTLSDANLQAPDKEN